MTLDRDDINAIADAVVIRLQIAESIKKDAQYAASLDLDELKRRGHEKLIATRKRRSK